MSISWEAYNQALGRPIDSRGPVNQQPQQHISLEEYNAALGRPINQTYPTQQPYIPPVQQQVPQPYIQPVQPQQPQQQPSPVPSLSWADYNRALGRDVNWRPGMPTPPIPSTPPAAISWEQYNVALGRAPSWRPPNQPVVQQPVQQPVQQSPVPSLSWADYNRALGRDVNWRPGMPTPPIPSTPPATISWEQYNVALGRAPSWRPPNQPVAPQPNQQPSPVASLSWADYNRALGRDVNWRPGMPTTPIPSTPPASISWEQYNIALGRAPSWRPPNQPVAPQPNQPNMSLPLPNSPHISWQDYNTALGRPFSWRPGMPIPPTPAGYSTNNPPPTSISWETYNTVLGRPANWRPAGTSTVNPTSQIPNTSPIPGITWEQYNLGIGKPAYYRPGMAGVPNNPGYSTEVLPAGLTWEQFNLILKRPIDYRPNGGSAGGSSIPVQSDYAASTYELRKQQESQKIATDPTYKDPTQWIEKLLGFIPIIGGAYSFVSWFMMSFLVPGEGVSVEDYIKNQINLNNNAVALAEAQSYIDGVHFLNSARAIYEKEGSIRGSSNEQIFRSRLEFFINYGSQLLKSWISLKLYKPLAFLAFVHLTNLTEVCLNAQKWGYEDHVLDFRSRIWAESELVTNLLYQRNFDNVENTVLNKGSTPDELDYLRKTISALLLFRKEYNNINRSLDTEPQRSFVRKNIRVGVPIDVVDRNSLYVYDSKALNIHIGKWSVPYGPNLDRIIDAVYNTNNPSFFGISQSRTLLGPGLPEAKYSPPGFTPIQVPIVGLFGAQYQIRCLLGDSEEGVITKITLSNDKERTQVTGNLIQPMTVVYSLGAGPKDDNSIRLVASPFYTATSNKFYVTVEFFSKIQFYQFEVKVQNSGTN